MTAVRSDLTIEQNWEGYSEEEHAIWRLLFERQQRLLVGRACLEYLEGLAGLGVSAIFWTEPRGGRSSRCQASFRTMFSSPTSPAAGSRQPASSAAATSSTISRSRTSSTTSAAMCRC